MAELAKVLGRDPKSVGFTPEWCQLFCHGCILEKDAQLNAHAGG